MLRSYIYQKGRQMLFHASVLLLTFYFLPTQKAFCQIALKELKIGDKVPDVPLNMLNYPKQNIMLSEFKGKAIIIDFWATWCSPCVGSFAKMDSLQKKFESKLLILPVTYQDKATVDLLFTKMKANSNHEINRPATVINDKRLSRLFPHNTLPHYIWIGSDGVVKAITNMNQVTNKNIGTFLKSNELFLPVKKDNRILIDEHKPVFFGKMQIQLREDEIMYSIDSSYQSVLTGYRQEMQSGCYYDSNRIIRANGSIKFLFQNAFGKRKPELHSESRIILNVKDSSLVAYTGDEKDLDSYYKWRDGHLYCYEIIVPTKYDKSSKMGLEYMQNDLNQYFASMGISGKMELVQRKCYVLRKIPAMLHLTTSGGPSTITKNAFFYKITNQPLSVLLNDLRAYYWQLSQFPLIDETGIIGPIDIEINAKMSDVDAVMEALAKYGIELIEEIREIEMIVITQH